MNELQPYVEKHDKLTAIITAKAKELEDMSKELLKLRQTTIPDLMQELGLKEVAFEDGRTLSVGDYVNVKLPEDKNPSFDWLAEHGHGALVTCNVAAMMDRSDSATKLKKAMKILKDGGFDVEVKQSLHPSRLKAFVKQQLKEGIELPESLFTVQTGSIATIK
jgi:hypothetical protein